MSKLVETDNIVRPCCPEEFESLDGGFTVRGDLKDLIGEEIDENKSPENSANQQILKFQIRQAKS